MDEISGGYPPCLYGALRFRQNFAPCRHEGKINTAFRLMIVSEGRFTLESDFFRGEIRAGDALFLPPGETYSTAFGEDKTQLINVFFGFSPLLPPPRAEDLLFGMRPLVPENKSLSPLLFRAPELIELAERLAQTPRPRALRETLGAHALFYRLLEGFLERAEGADPRKARAREIKDYIDARPGERLTRESLAAVFHYHPNYLGELFRKTYGIAIGAYLLRARADRACRYLLETDLSVTDIAHELGFCDASHFIRRFRSRTGVSPGDFRKKGV